MLKEIHKKVASSVSKVEPPPHYEWMRWLNPAIPKYISIEPIYLTLYDFDNSNCKFSSAAEVYSKFMIGSFKYEGIDDLNFKKLKSRNIFFKVGKATVENRNDYLIDEAAIAGSIMFEQLEDGFLFRVINKDKKEKKVLVYAGVKDYGFIVKSGKIKETSALLPKAKIEKIEKLIEAPKNKEIDYQISEGAAEQFDHQIKPSKIRQKNYEIESPEIVNEFCGIETPEIIDQISELKPKVFKIDLLNFELDKNICPVEDHSSNLECKSRIYQLPILQKDQSKVKTFFMNKFEMYKPVVTRLNNLSFGIPAVRREELIFASTEQKVLLLDEEKLPADTVEIRTDLLSSAGNDFYKLKRILLPSANVNQSLIEKSKMPLFPFQKKGAKFLLSHKFALLADELGLGKTMQATDAMLKLFEKGKIKSALLIVPPEDFGSFGLSEKLDDKIGWCGHLQKYAKGLTISAQEGFNDQRKKEWDKYSNIYVSTFNQLSEDLSENLVPAERLAQFDCVIFDEIQLSMGFGGIINELLHTINPEYFWALSSMPVESIEEKLSAICDLFIITMRRTKTEIAMDIPKVTRQFQWFEMDEFQKSEYTLAEEEGKRQLADFLDTGNPYRFQANAFFHIHKLKQAANYSTEDKLSPKDEHLLKQYEVIKQSGKKMLILSQYDDQSTKRLMNIFQQRGIKYYEFTQSGGNANLEKTIKDFEKDRKSFVFIANIKNRLDDLKFSKISYVIYYDVWWNPVQRLQLEKEIVNKASENITFFGYLTRDTIEERIWLRLSEKDMLNFDEYYDLTTEEFNAKLNEEDWLNILSLERQHLNNTA